MVLVGLVVLAGTAGCGVLGGNDDATEPTVAAPSSSTAPATTQPAAAPVSDPDAKVVIAQVPLEGGGLGDGATLVVTSYPVMTGRGVPVPEVQRDCPIDDAAVQVVPVSVELVGGAGETVPDPGSTKPGSTYGGGSGQGGLAGHLTVTAGATTPADLGDVGVFFEPATRGEAYCTDAPPLPDTDTFWARGTSRVVAYVAVDQAVGPAFPQGRGDVLSTLQARVSDLRLRDGDGTESPLSLGTPFQGALCADDPAALCVPLH